MTSDKWLNAKQAAEAIGVSQATMGRWLGDGKIPAHRIGRAWRIDKAVFDLWLRGTSNLQFGGEEIPAPQYSLPGLHKGGDDEEE